MCSERISVAYKEKRSTAVNEEMINNRQLLIVKQQSDFLFYSFLVVFVKSIAF